MSEDSDRSTGSKRDRRRPNPLELGGLSFGKSALANKPADGSNTMAPNHGKPLALRSAVSHPVLSSQDQAEAHQQDAAMKQARSKTVDLHRSLISPSMVPSHELLVNSPMSPTAALPLIQQRKLSQAQHNNQAPVRAPSPSRNTSVRKTTIAHPTPKFISPASPLRNVMSRSPASPDIPIKQGPPLALFRRASRTIDSPRSIGRSLRSRTSQLSRQGSVRSIRSEASRFSDSSVHGIRGRFKHFLSRCADKL
jgi:hypothetical protein